MGVSAWGQVFASASEPHWDALLRFGVNLGLSREESRDVLQNALIRGMKYFETFARGQLGFADPAEAERALAENAALSRRFRGWLFTVVRNSAYDLHGAKGKREMLLDEAEWEGIAQRASLEPETAAAKFQAEGSSPTPVDEKSLESEAEALFASAADDELLGSLGSLNARQKSILYLVAEEHTYAEVASILGIPIGTVMSGLSRALKKVKMNLTRSRSEGGAGSDEGAGGRRE